MRNRLKVPLIAAIILCFCFLCVGFAALNDTLSVGGTVDFDKDVIFQLDAGKLWENLPSSVTKIEIDSFDNKKDNPELDTVFGNQKWETDGTPVADNSTEMKDGVKLFIGGNNNDTAYVLAWGDFPVTLPQKCSYTYTNNGTQVTVSMFEKATNLQSVKFGNIVTVTKGANDSTLSKYTVTNTHCMFEKCVNLTYINFGSKFDTSEVGDMSNMFYSCQKLERIEFDENAPAQADTSKATKIKFNTEKVVHMAYMFSNCYKLTKLDLSDFNTSNEETFNVTSSDGKQERLRVNDMFRYCSGLTSIEFGANFKTIHTEYYGNMFYHCEKLEKLNLSTFTPSNVSIMTSMFDSCFKLTYINFGENFDTSNVTDMSLMFRDCSALEKIEYKPYSADWDKEEEEASSGEEEEAPPEITTLKFDFDTSIVTSMSGMFRNIAKNSGNTFLELDLESFSTSSTQSVDLSSMFRTSTRLQNVKFGSSFAANKANISWLFYGCTNLKGGVLEDEDGNALKDEDENVLYELDLSSFVCTDVASVWQAFYNCSNLASLDLSKFNSTKTSINRADLASAFFGCTSLAKLDLSSFEGKYISSFQNVFNFIINDVPANCPLKELYLNKFEGGSWDKQSDGTYKRNGIGTLTTFFDEKEDKTDYTYPLQGSLEILNLEGFAGASITSASKAFYGFTNLKELYLDAFTGEVATSTSSMFEGCGSLTTLHLSKFTGATLESAASMFKGCGSLTGISLSDFVGNRTAGKAVDMTEMFEDCVLLETLVLNSDKLPDGSTLSDGSIPVSSMSYMFQECKALTSLDLSKFNAGNSVAKIYMFKNCNALETVTLGAAFKFTDANSYLPDKSYKVNPNDENPTVKWTDWGVNIQTGDTNPQYVKTPADVATYQNAGNARNVYSRKAA